MRQPTDFEREINRRLAPIFRDFERDMQRVELERIKADPEKYRDTRLMGERGLRYRYFELKTGKSSCVRFGWTTVPNAAGYYLTWTEKRDSKGAGSREHIRGHKLRKDAKESALKGYENFKAARA